MAKNTCDCCGRKELTLKQYYWSGDDLICFDCFRVWYEEGIASKKDIKRIVLKIKD